MVLQKQHTLTLPTATVLPLVIIWYYTNTYPHCNDRYSATTIIKLVLHPQHHTHTAPTAKAPPLVLRWYCIKQQTHTAPTAIAPQEVLTRYCAHNNIPTQHKSYSATTSINMVLRQQQTHTAMTTTAPLLVLTWYCTQKNIPTLHRPPQRHH